MATIVKHPHITDGRDQRRRRQRANTGDRQQALALRMRGRQRLEFLIVLGHFCF